MTDRVGHTGLVTIFGGAGFVGRYVVKVLAERGWRVKVASRRPDLAGHLQPMGAVGQIAAVQANLRDKASISRAVAGADAVVNLVAILAPSGRQTFSALHVDGARNVAEAATQAGASAFVHVSAIGADARSSSAYGRTKAAGELAVREAFPGAVILRPSIVFGPEDRFFNRFAAMAQLAPALPLIAGNTRFQPVYVADLAEAVANAVEGAGSPGTIYEIGGPEVLTFRALMERMLDYTGRRRWLLPVPTSIAKLGALMTKPLPSALRPLTVDQVRLLQRDNIVSEAAIREGRTLAALGVDRARAIASVVPGYLERFRPDGRPASYRG